jgi:hypothetical protein
MKNNKCIYILFFLLLFTGCTKNDFTWNIQKKPCVISFSNSTEDYLSLISLGGMTNSTLGSGPRNFFKDKPISLTKGQQYELNVGYVSNSSQLGVYAYFDWNCDGDFEDSEENLVITNNINLSSATVSFTIPNSAKIGETVARFIIRAEYSVGNYPCFEEGFYGEVEDYPLKIK